MVDKAKRDYVSESVKYDLSNYREAQLLKNLPHTLS